MSTSTPTIEDEKENKELIVINGQKFEVQFEVVNNQVAIKLVPISNNPVPDPEIPKELGTVKEGGWGGNIQDASKWTTVNMRDNPALIKIVDENNVNIATGFTTKELAEAVIKFVQQTGWAEFENLLKGGPANPPPPPEPGTGGGGVVGKNVYKTTGKTMTPKSTGFKTRHYASGKPDDTTIEWNAPGCPYDAYEAYGDFIIGKPEHDDRLDVKLWGPSHKKGIGAWYIFAIQFSDGETSFGWEQPHPKTESSVMTGKTFGDIRGNKTIGFKGVIWPLEGAGAHVEGYIDLKDGNGWQLALAADNPGGKKFKRDKDQQIQFRIDAAPQLKGENIIVEEIVMPAQKVEA